MYRSSVIKTWLEVNLVKAPILTNYTVVSNIWIRQNRIRNVVVKISLKIAGEYLHQDSGNTARDSNTEQPVPRRTYSKPCGCLLELIRAPTVSTITHIFWPEIHSCWISSRLYLYWHTHISAMAISKSNRCPSRHKFNVAYTRHIIQLTLYVVEPMCTILNAFISLPFPRSGQLGDILANVLDFCGVLVEKYGRHAFNTAFSNEVSQRLLRIKAIAEVSICVVYILQWLSSYCWWWLKNWMLPGQWPVVTGRITNIPR